MSWSGITQEILENNFHVIPILSLKKDMESEFVINHIAKSNALARRIGFSGTPLFIIEGKFFPGFVPLEELELIISDIRESRM